MSRWFALTLLLTGCIPGLTPNKAPRVTHMNGTELERFGGGGVLVPPISFELGATITLTFQIEDPERQEVEVYFPEPHPGWSWDAETRTVTWDVPETLADPNHDATMLVLDTNRRAPKHTELYLPLFTEEDVDLGGEGEETL